MYKGSLFERLTPLEQKGKKTFDTYEESLYNSIAFNLSRIFSTNAGSSEIARDYGRPDLDNMHLNLNDSIHIIEKRSQECIKKYEPRLFHNTVKVNEQRLSYNEMSIFIEAFVKVNGKTKRLHFKADLFKTGGVRVYKDGI